jgi:hypothetical protein
MFKCTDIGVRKPAAGEASFCVGTVPFGEPAPGTTRKTSIRSLDVWAY